MSSARRVIVCGYTLLTGCVPETLVCSACPSFSGRRIETASQDVDQGTNMWVKTRNIDVSS